MMTEESVQQTYALTPLELGLKLKECVQEIQRLEAVIRTLKSDEDTVLSREIMEALEGEVKRYADQLILVKLRIKGRTEDQVREKLLSCST